jgi:hypothetical protein
MNRRNFLGSLIAAVPAIALGLRGKAALHPVIVHEGPAHEVTTQPLGEWMRQPATLSCGTSQFRLSGMTQEEYFGMIDRLQSKETA